MVSRGAHEIVQTTGVMMAKSGGSRRPRRSVGRPSKDQAGDVAASILDAAERIFLERGYQTASLDDIAAAAPASKPTIYAHFPGKEALFAAVVVRITKRMTDFEGYSLEGRSVQDKLISLGTAIVERAIEDTVGVTRATIAEAPRFPELSRNVHDAARNQAASTVSRLLEEATQLLARAPKGPLSAKRSLATAQIFMDLILLPMLMRALLGEEAKGLRKEIPAFVRERVGFFLAACEADWRG
jgi:AcrR family transcriptional regulator